MEKTCSINFPESRVIEKYRHSFYPLSSARKDLQPVLKLKQNQIEPILVQMTTNHPRHLNPLIVEDEDVSFGVEAQTHWLLQLTIAWG